MALNTQKDQRLNLRLSSEALSQIKAAASLCQQDVTSFLLGAGLDRSRAVLAEDRVLRLTGRDAADLQRAFDREPEIVPALAALLRRRGELGQQRHAPEV